MENQSDLIRKQMNETRVSLTEKLETLENQVSNTVQEATASVTETVESVKEAVISSVATVQGSVRDTVDTVKDTFDVAQWVRRHPWAMMAGSVAVGFAAGTLLRPQTKPTAPYVPDSFPNLERRNGFTAAENLARASVPARRNWWDDVVNSFAAEAEQLKSLAISTLLGMARDYVARQVPGPVAPRLAEILDDMTTKFGGKPLAAPLWQSADPNAASHSAHR